MIGWLIFAAYVVVAVALWRWFALSMLEALDRVNPVDNGDRAAAAVTAVVVTLLWPISLTVAGAARLVSGPVARTLTTERERREAMQEELAQLRRVAEEYGLDDGRRP